MVNGRNNEEMVSGWPRFSVTKPGVSPCKRLSRPWFSGLFPASQVFLINTSQPLLDTVDTHDLSLASWMCPLPLAPAKPSLPTGSDLMSCRRHSWA